jgi:hypothetical protein
MAAKLEGPSGFKLHHCNNIDIALARRLSVRRDRLGRRRRGVSMEESRAGRYLRMFVSCRYCPTPEVVLTWKH